MKSPKPQFLFGPLIFVRFPGSTDFLPFYASQIHNTDFCRAFVGLFIARLSSSVVPFVGITFCFVALWSHSVVVPRLRHT